MIFSFLLFLLSTPRRKRGRLRLFIDDEICTLSFHKYLHSLYAELPDLFLAFTRCGTGNHTGRIYHSARPTARARWPVYIPTHAPTPATTTYHPGYYHTPDAKRARNNNLSTSVHYAERPDNPCRICLK